jgi:hypothetical protein
MADNSPDANSLSAYEPPSSIDGSDIDPGFAIYYPDQSHDDGSGLLPGDQSDDLWGPVGPSPPTPPWLDNIVMAYGRGEVSLPRYGEGSWPYPDQGDAPDMSAPIGQASKVGSDVGPGGNIDGGADTNPGDIAETQGDMNWPYYAALMAMAQPRSGGASPVPQGSAPATPGVDRSVVQSPAAPEGGVVNATDSYGTTVQGEFAPATTDANGVTTVDDVEVVAPKPVHAGPQGPTWQNPLSDVLGKIWSFPNTEAGLLAAAASWAAGKFMGTDPHFKFGDNAIQLLNSPLNIDRRAYALGNVQIYPVGNGPDRSVRSYTGAMVRNGAHEGGHSTQGQILGPWFIPAEILGSMLGNKNPLEVGADKAALGRSKSGF